MALPYYRVPMAYASWSWQELAAALLCALSHGEGTRARLKSRIEELCGGEVTLWASGRAALDAAFRALARDNPGRHEVLMPSLLCASVAERALAAGLTPRFYDIRPDLTPDLDKAREAIGSATACIVVPHLYGNVVDLACLASDCRAAGIPLIEDCAAAFLLPCPDGTPCGRQADIAIFSFNTGKTLTAGGGGALVVHTGPRAPDPRHWPPAEERRQALGRLWFALAFAWPSFGYALFRSAPWRRWKALAPQPLCGRTIADVDAHIVDVQWRRWPALRARRLHVLKLYADALSHLPGISLPQYRPGLCLTRLFVQFPANVNDPGRPLFPVREWLRCRGVQTHLPYAPLHLDPRFGAPQPGACPVAESVASRCLALPSHPELGERQILFVCRALGAIAEQLERGKMEPLPPRSAGFRRARPDPAGIVE